MTFDGRQRTPMPPPQPVSFSVEEEEEFAEAELGTTQYVEAETLRPRYEDPLADLFEAPQPDDWDFYTDDLVEVDIEEDVVDGPLDDLVSTVGIEGDEFGQQARYKPVVETRRPPVRRLQPPPPPGGFSGIR